MLLYSKNSSLNKSHKTVQIIQVLQISTQDKITIVTLTENHTFWTLIHTRGAYSIVTTWLTVGLGSIDQFIGFVPLSPLYSYWRESTAPSSRQLTLQLDGGAALAAARRRCGYICISVARQIGGTTARWLHVHLGGPAARSCGSGYVAAVARIGEPNPHSCCCRSLPKVAFVLAVWQPGTP